MTNQLINIINSFNLSEMTVESFCEFHNYDFFKEEHREIIIISDLKFELYIARNDMGKRINYYESYVIGNLSQFSVVSYLDYKILVKPLIPRLDKKISTIKDYIQLSKMNNIITRNFSVIQLKIEDFGLYNGNIVLLNTLGLVPDKGTNLLGSPLQCDHCSSQIAQNINDILNFGNFCQNCGKELSLHNVSIMNNINFFNLKGVIKNGY